jgi:hypothetical protein
MKMKNITKILLHYEEKQFDYKSSLDKPVNKGKADLKCRHNASWFFFLLFFLQLFKLVQKIKRNHTDGWYAIWWCYGPSLLNVQKLFAYFYLFIFHQKVQKYIYKKNNRSKNEFLRMHWNIESIDKIIFGFK